VLEGIATSDTNGGGSVIVTYTLSELQAVITGLGSAKVNGVFFIAIGQ